LVDSKIIFSIFIYCNQKILIFCRTDAIESNDKFEPTFVDQMGNYQEAPLKNI